jgi:RNA polymerase sigma-54 factor
VDLSFNLYQEQTQKLVMTTQMKQALEVLQYSALELVDYVAEFAVDNPFADYDPQNLDEQIAWTQKLQRSWHQWSGREARQTVDQQVAIEQSLEDHVVAQLHLLDASPAVKQVAERLAGNLDESGYLRDSEAALKIWLNVSDATLADAIELLQSCEPAGIGARSLQECLHLQVDTVEVELRSLVDRLITDYLNEVAAGKLMKIAKELRQPPAVIQNAVDRLRKLNPKPGFALGSTVTPYIVPDVVVQRIENHYVVSTHESATPVLRVNRSYLQLLRQQKDAETRTYLAKKLQSAQWVAKCIEQRRMTLLRVAEAIVEMQREFFDYGVSAMKPLTLRHIADRLGVHESTVSRATRSKYMLAPSGLYEMKFFFSAELQGDDGLTSAQAAKYEINRLIAGENAAKPYSDEALVRQLKQYGIQISRRTVAKYRDELQIAPSWRRKRYEG